MLLLTFFSACKKEVGVIERPKTFADFERIMATDPRIQSLITTNNLLVGNRSVPNTLIYNSTIKPSKVITKTSQQEIDMMLTTAENKDDLLVIFEKAKIEKSHEKVNLISQQLEALTSFSKEYPELRKLRKDEINKLLTSIINKTNVEQSTTAFFIKSNPYNPISSSDCAQTWSKTVNRCERNYNLALMAVWADVLYSSIFTAGFAAGPATGAGLVASGALYIANEFCISDATDFFDRI